MGRPAPGHERDTTRIGFWAHQLVEYLLAVLLLAEGIRQPHDTAAVMGLGGALLVVAATSDGPLAARRVVGRRLHRVLDVVLAVVLATAPLTLSVHGGLGIVVLEAAAAAMLWLVTHTRPERRTATPAPPAPAPAQPRAPAEAPEPPRATATPRRKPPARRLGAAVGDARRYGPRVLGRVVGRQIARQREKRDPET